MNREALARRALGLALSMTFAGGCGREERERERVEASRVSRAIDVLRQAGNAEKAPLLLALRHAPCTFERVCRVQHDCVGAYELELRALDAVRAARQSLGGDGGHETEVSELVVRAERDLARSLELQQRCLTEQGALHVDLKF